MYDKAHIYIRMNTRGDNAKNRNNNEQRIKSNGWKGIWRCQAVFSLHTFIIKFDFLDSHFWNISEISRIRFKNTKNYIQPILPTYLSSHAVTFPNPNSLPSNYPNISIILCTGAWTCFALLYYFLFSPTQILPILYSFGDPYISQRKEGHKAYSIGFSSSLYFS